MKRKKHRLTVFIWLLFFTTELHMLVGIHLSSTKEKRVLFFQAFHLVPLVWVTSVQGLVRVLPALFLPGLLWKCPSSPGLLLAGLLLLTACPLIISFFFFWRWRSPACPAKSSLVLRRVARENYSGCTVGASIADARFLSGTVALAPHSRSWPLTPLLALCPGHPLLCSCPQRPHSDAFLSMCLAHITAYLKKVLHYLLKNLSFHTHSKCCYVLNGTFWGLSRE